MIALSSCLHGDPVRYDGADKRDAWLLDALGRFVEYRPICPEVGIGLGVPRAPIRLVRENGETRVRGVADPSLDVTDRLQRYAREIVPELADACGYVFKSRSPSCGLLAVDRYDRDGQLLDLASGAFAAVIASQLPALPLEEEGRLANPVLREHFVARVFALRRWRDLLAEGPDAARLIAFHTRHKYQLMAHSSAACNRLGRLLADLSGGDLQPRIAAYGHEFLATLAQPATRAGQANVLQHLAGCLNGAVDRPARAELADAIERYRRGMVPLLVPIQLLMHHVARHSIDAVAEQSYLNPYPAGLDLRRDI